MLGLVLLLPHVESCPLMSMLSFNDIGRPCSGPTTCPVAARCWSSKAARSIASWNSSSVQQPTSCWASAARLQNARATSTALKWPVAILFKRARASSISVMVSSSRVRRVHPRMYNRALRGNAARGGSRHPWGMRSICAARFSRARLFQSGLCVDEAIPAYRGCYCLCAHTEYRIDSLVVLQEPCMSAASCVTGILLVLFVLALQARVMNLFQPEGEAAFSPSLAVIFCSTRQFPY